MLTLYYLICYNAFSRGQCLLNEMSLSLLNVKEKHACTLGVSSQNIVVVSYNKIANSRI